MASTAATLPPLLWEITSSNEWRAFRHLADELADDAAYVAAGSVAMVEMLNTVSTREPELGFRVCFRVRVRA
jgi:hypothetical protein